MSNDDVDVTSHKNKNNNRKRTREDKDEIDDDDDDEDESGDEDVEQDGDGVTQVKNIGGLIRAYDSGEEEAEDDEDEEEDEGEGDDDDAAEDAKEDEMDASDTEQKDEVAVEAVTGPVKGPTSCSVCSNKVRRSLQVIYVCMCPCVGAHRLHTVFCVWYILTVNVFIYNTFISCRYLLPKRMQHVI
jgi:hypothetical protein